MFKELVEETKVMYREKNNLRRMGTRFSQPVWQLGPIEGNTDCVVSNRPPYEEVYLHDRSLNTVYDNYMRTTRLWIDEHFRTLHNIAQAKL